jgi:hypothetical protein
MQKASVLLIGLFGIAGPVQAALPAPTESAVTPDRRAEIEIYSLPNTAGYTRRFGWRRTRWRYAPYPVYGGSYGYDAGY